MHLTPEQLVDMAEGSRGEASLAHLAVCAVCRQQVVEARAMMASIADAEVPEPSPLFWDHFSRRVSEAVAAEGRPRPWWLGALWVPASALVFVALLAWIGPRVMPARGSNQTTTASQAQDVVAVSARGELPSASAADDQSLDLVAGLTEAAGVDVGLASRGSAEDAVAQLSGGELQELGRLLREELAHAGA